MTLPDATEPLGREEADAAFALLLDDGLDDEDIRDFILTLSLRDETPVEIAAAIRAIRARMIAVAAPEGAIDVCGTGGDMSNSVNVSTAVAIVVAACGVPVAKHGNRAASSQAGGADTLEALGLNLDRASETAEATLADLGIAFLFAQKHHPALARLAPIRKSIARRTIFNLTGPACNPAGVRRQLIGVARPDFLPVYAEALAMLETEDAMLVAGDEPLDELSVSGPSTVLRVVSAHPRYSNPVRPELVEGAVLFFRQRQRKGRCFDKLSTGGCWRNFAHYPRRRRPFPPPARRAARRVRSPQRRRAAPPAAWRAGK